MKSISLLPPSPNCCQVCAAEHDPSSPHNLQSLFYATWFHQQHGRSHTWADAMAHCSEEVKAPWLKYLSELGIDPNSTDIMGRVTSSQQIDQALGSVFRKAKRRYKRMG